MKPKFKHMKKMSKKLALSLDVDQIEKDYESYEQMIKEDLKKEKKARKVKNAIS